MAKRVAILGAGITGLTLAWYLRQLHGHDIELILFEKSSRAGGWIQTIQKDDFLFELGPRSCRPQGTGVHTLALLKELGLEEQVIYPDPSAHRRYLYLNKQLQPIPTTPWQWLFSPLKKGVCKALWNDWHTAPYSGDETIYEFVSRRLSPELAERFVDPLVSGIYAGNIKELSVQSCFPKLKEWEEQGGGILKGILKAKKSDSTKAKGPLFTLSNGMESLPATLAKQLNSSLRLNTSIDSIEHRGEQLLLQTTGGTMLEVDYLYSTIPSKMMGKYFKVPAIPTTSIAVVSLGYRRKVLDRKGFGYLIPSSQKEQILGAVWDSSIFPTQNQSEEQTRLTVMIGGSHMTNFDDHEESDFYRIACDAMRKHLSIHAIPDLYHVHLARGAIPQYQVGHREFVEQIKKQISMISTRIQILGSSYSGVSVNDCIAEAKKIAEESSLFFAKKK